jgi:hypothetical protein
MAATKKAPKAEAVGEFESVTKFVRDYEDALAEARISAEHTATEGWQALYAGHRKAMETRRLELADSIRLLADEIEKYGPNPDIEKAIGNAKKLAEDIRETDQKFQETTVAPVRRCVEVAAKVIADATTAARNEERQTPLINNGLADAMQAAVSQVYRVTFDTDRGVVALVAPRG